MAEFEEETYSTIFAALKHPTRRKILRLLSEKPRSFTEMQNLFKVDSPYLTYHLDSLKELVSKTEDGRYRLSTMGEGAVALMSGVEETPRIAARRYSLPLRWKAVTGSALLIIGLILFVGVAAIHVYPLPFGPVLDVSHTYKPEPWVNAMKQMFQFTSFVEVFSIILMIIGSVICIYGVVAKRQLYTSK